MKHGETKTRVLALLNAAKPKGVLIVEICKDLDMKYPSIKYHLDHLCQEGKAHLVVAGKYAAGPLIQESIMASPSATLVKPDPEQGDKSPEAIPAFTDPDPMPVGNGESNPTGDSTCSPGPSGQTSRSRPGTSR
jgi:hypothetical protein